MFISKANGLIRSKLFKECLDVLCAAVEANGHLPVYEQKLKELLALDPGLREELRKRNHFMHGHASTTCESALEREIWLDNFFGFSISLESLDVSGDLGGMTAHIQEIRQTCLPSVVIPSFNDCTVLRACIDSIILHAANVIHLIIVSDDCSTDVDHIDYLSRLEESGREYGIPVFVCRAPSNQGFSANVNRGIRKAKALNDRADILLLNSDTQITSNSVERMALLARDQNAIVGARLLYPDGSIQHGGGFRNFNHLEWFDHLYRGFGASNSRTTCISPRLYCTAAALYIPHEAFTRTGYLDESFQMGFEDVDYCLRAWDCGIKVFYNGLADIVHHESITRGRSLGEREKLSKDYFWAKYGDKFNMRKLDNGDGIVNIVFVLQDTGIGGGHRVAFMFANHLASSGFRVSIFSLSVSPTWFALHHKIEFRSFPDYKELICSLKPLDAIKVATWWETAMPVWEASLRNGLPVWLSQDIESSYYHDHAQKIRVLASYMPEFVYIVNYKWIQRFYAEKFYYHSHYVGLGVDVSVFYPDPGVIRKPKTILFSARSEPLKGFRLMMECIPLLLNAGYRLVAFGSEPALVAEWPLIEFHFRPSDEELRHLYSGSEFFVQTSIHEGFSLPPLEAMACGAISVMTNATGNMDYANHMKNCIIIDAAPESLMGALSALGNDSSLKSELTEEAAKTVEAYLWDDALQRLSGLFMEIANTPLYGKQLYPIGLGSDLGDN